MCGGGSKPSTPPPPPPPPKPVQKKDVTAAANEARDSQREKAKSATGVKSTILNNPFGESEEAKTKKKVLG